MLILRLPLQQRTGECRAGVQPSGIPASQQALERTWVPALEKMAAAEQAVCSAIAGEGTRPFTDGTEPRQI